MSTGAALLIVLLILVIAAVAFVGGRRLNTCPPGQSCQVADGSSVVAFYEPETTSAPVSASCQGGTIQVVDARYGPADLSADCGTGPGVIDVTAQIGAKMNGLPSFTFTGQAGELDGYVGSDPCPGAAKMLAVAYTCQ